MSLVTDLTTLADVKSWLGIVGTSDDALLTRLISALSLQFAQRTRRDNLASVVSYSETYNGTGGDTLALKRYPITAVSLLKINGIVVPASPDALQTGYEIESDIGLIRLVGYAFTSSLPQQPPTTFYPGYQNVIVNYSAGYAAPPLDIAQAVIDWVAWIYRRRGRIGEVSKNIQGAVVAFSQRDIPPEVDSVISRYADKIPI